MDIVPYNEPLSNYEMSVLLEQVKSSEMAQQRRNELSEQSFMVWLQDVFTQVALTLGYSLTMISEFFKTLGYAFSTGFEQGRNMARQRGELDRERIRRRFG